MQHFAFLPRKYDEQLICCKLQLNCPLLQTPSLRWNVLSRFAASTSLDKGQKRRQRAKGRIEWTEINPLPSFHWQIIRTRETESSLMSFVLPNADLIGAAAKRFVPSASNCRLGNATAFRTAAAAYSPLTNSSQSPYAQKLLPLRIARTPRPAAWNSPHTVTLR